MTDSNSYPTSGTEGGDRECRPHPLGSFVIRMLTRLTPSSLSNSTAASLTASAKSERRSTSVAGGARDTAVVRSKCTIDARAGTSQRTTGAFSLTDRYYDDALLVWDPAMSATLDIEASVRPTWSILGLPGRGRHLDRRLARGADRRLLEAGSRVVLDLSGVSFIDSTGLRLVISTRQRLSEDGDLALVAQDGPVTRLLAITGLDGAFPVFATVEEATVSRRGQR